MKINPDILPPPREPYRGVPAFRLLDWRIFFERERETERLGNLISMYASVLLYGQSGTGKSSLLNAGLLPNALSRGYAPERIRVFPDPEHALLIERIRLREDDTTSSVGAELPRYLPSRFTSEDNDERVAVSAAQFLEILSRSSDLGMPLLIFDQFEEYVTLFDETRVDKNCFAAAQQARAGIENLIRELLLSDPFPVKIVFAFRDDYFARLTALFSRIPDLMDHGVRLVLPDIELLHHIVRGPFLASDKRGIKRGQFGEELSEEMAQKIEGGIRANQRSRFVNLSEVQTLCLALWKRPPLRIELLHTTNIPAFLRRIIKSEAMASLRAKFYRWNRVRAIAVLANLVTEDGTRNVVAHQMLVSQTRRNPMLWVFRGKWRKFLERLSETGLVRRSLTSGTTFHYELTSEFLIPQIQRWQQRLRMQRQIIVAGICVILIALPWSLLQRARSAEQESTREKQAALEVITWMGSDLWRDLVGKPDLLRKVNDRVMKYLNENPPKLNDFDAQKVKAWAIYQKASLLAMKGEVTQAIEQLDEELHHFDKFPADSQKDIDFRYLVCVTKDKIAAIYLVQGDLESASKRYEEELTRLKEIAQQIEDNPTVLDQMSDAYTGLGDTLYYQGNLPGAIESYTMSADLLAKLPSDDISSRRISIADANIASVLFSQGYLDEARQRYDEGLLVAKKLVEHDPRNSSWQRTVSLNQGGLGDIAVHEGQFEAAKKAYAESLRISKILKEQEPDNDWRQSQLSYSLTQAGDLTCDQGDWQGAYEFYYKPALSILETLAGKNAKNLEWQTSVATTQRRIADALRREGKLKAALEASQYSVSALRKLITQTSSNTIWQADLSDSEEEIGDVLLDQRNSEAALANYQQTLAVRHKLADLDPTNTSWKNSLSNSYDKIGQVLQQRGDLSGALEKFSQALTIREELAKLALSSAAWRAALGYSYFHVGMTRASSEPNSKSESRAMIIKGRGIMRQLKEEKALTAEQQEWLDEIEAELRSGKKAR